MSGHNGRPLLVYNGDCGFCRAWVRRWKRRTGAAVAYAPYQNVRDRFPGIDEKQCREAVQLVLPDGAVLTGAAAVFKLLAFAPRRKYWYWLYRHVPGFAALSETAYRIVARHRPIASRIAAGLVRKRDRNT